MANMFGGFGGPGQWTPNGRNLGQGAVQSVAPVGGGPGGFPGIFPGMGPGQSGAAGLVEFQQRVERCVQERACPVTYGPPVQWL